MSSCFLCDCTYKFLERDKHDVLVPGSAYGQGPTVVKKFMKQVPIMVGSSGTELNDQQHDNSKNQNYFPYRVKKIEFCFSMLPSTRDFEASEFPNYVLIFKVPFREPIFDYYFYLLESFMLYSEPESVLGYKVIQPLADIEYLRPFKYPANYKIEINKPFILGPNEYLGVFYMFDQLPSEKLSINASAKVWFDTA